MATNPYSDFEQPAAPKPPGRKSLTTVVVSIGGLTVFLCGGFGTLLFYGYQQITPNPPVPLANAPDSYQQSLDEFNAGLAELVSEATDETPLPEQSKSPTIVEIESFLQQSFKQLDEGDDLAFNDAQFMQAVTHSRHLVAPLQLLDRVQLRTWLAASPPVPWGGSDSKIVGIQSSQPRLATVDLLLDIGSSEAESIRWHLVKEDDAWQLYDWRDLGDGLSMSDEYAAYLSSDSDVAEGYDKVFELIDEAQSASYSDDSEAQRLLRLAEATPLLDTYRPPARLRIAYAWRNIGEYDEAIRVLDSIPEPDRMLGVWPLVANCHLENGDYDQAMAAVERLEQITPKHPNVHILRSDIWFAQDELEKSVEAALRAVQIVPEDSLTWQTVITRSDLERIAEQLPTWIPWLIRGDHTYVWLDLLEAASLSSSPDQVASQLEAAQAPAGLNHIARGNAEYYQSRYDAAVQHFLEAEKATTMEDFVDYVRQRRTEIRLETHQYQKLLSDGPQPDQNWEHLATMAYSYELECDLQAMLNGIEPLSSESPWRPALLAYLYDSLGNDREAVRYFEALAKQPMGEDLDDDWVQGEIQDAHVECLLRQDRWRDVLKQWPNDVMIHFQVGNYILGLDSPESTASFLSELSNLSKKDLWSLHAQRERALTAQAIRAGQVDTAREHHLRVMQLVGEPFSLDWDWDVFSTRELIDEYARLVVEHSVDAEAPKYDDPDARRSFLLATVEFATQRCDTKTVDTLLRQLRQDLDNRFTAFAVELQFLRQQGRDAEALALCESLLDKLEELQDDHEHAIDAAAEYFLSKGKYGEALRCLDVLQETEEPAMRVALAKGDGVAVTQALREVDAEEVPYVLARHAAWLRLHAHEDWVAALQEKYKPALMPRYAEEMTSLLFPIDTQLSEHDIRQALLTVLGSHGDIRPVSTANPNAQAWCFSVPERSLRVVATLQRTRVRATNGPVSIQEKLREPIQMLSLEWLRDGVSPRMPTKLREQAFRVAAQLAASGAFALSLQELDYDSRVWPLGDSLSWLRWQDGIPHADSMASSDLHAMPETSFPTMPWSRWYERLKKSPEGVTVEVVLDTHQCKETIPGTLLEVERDVETLSVRLEASSQLEPLAVKGRIYSFEAYEVRLASNDRAGSE